jgi:hypothetical protein
MLGRVEDVVVRHLLTLEFRCYRFAWARCRRFLGALGRSLLIARVWRVSGTQQVKIPKPIALASNVRTDGCPSMQIPRRTFLDTWAYM